MRSRHAVALGSLVSWACTDPAPASESAPELVSESVPRSALVSVPEPGVPYDCTGFPKAEKSCAPTAPWVVLLHQMGQRFFEPKGDREVHPSKVDCEHAHAALDQALKADLGKLIIEEQVVAQNGAYRLFGPLNCDAFSKYTGLSQKAAKAVARLALPQDVLKKLGDQPFADLKGWLGPPEKWVDRTVSHEHLMHDQFEFYTRGFRPVAIGPRRAVFSQLIAIAKDWSIHLTPVVGRVELRRSEAMDAPACVGKLDVHRLRCGDRISALQSLEKLPASRFVVKVAEGRVGCDRCHGNPNTASNLSPLVDPSHLKARKVAFFKEAKAQAQEVARALLR